MELVLLGFWFVWNWISGFACFGSLVLLSGCSSFGFG